MNLTDILTTQQVAQELNLTLRQVQKLCQSGRLGQKVGGRYLITRQDLDSFEPKPRKVGRPPKAP